MPQFVIEREIAGVGEMSAEALSTMARKTREVVADPSADVHWLYSFVSEDRTYCVYLAPDEAVLRERSERAGFPVTRVSEVKQVLGPDTASID